MSGKYWINYQHLDAQQSIFFPRQLEQIEARLLETKYADLLGLQLVPIDTSVDRNKELVTVRSYNSVGKAKLMASYSDDAPRADVFMNETTTNLKWYHASYGYNVDEIRAAASVNTPLEMLKANAAKKAIDQQLDTVASVGDLAASTRGLINQTGTTTYTIPADGTGSSKLWADKTPKLILRDMFEAEKKMVDATDGIEKPDTMLLPLSNYGLIATTPFNDFSDVTILKFFLATAPYIKQVIPWYALEDAYLTANTVGLGDLSDARMVVYRKSDMDVAKMIVPVMFETDAPQLENYEYTVRCRAKTGGVVSQYPKAICYADGI